ncbi:FMN-dependent NADH-azoreductase [Kushneria aurantia]|uniref:FMN dependent NADH:quinone oxidoreductase n=1 Tax=Kushneria aurantia TaxID=504092 RepID=A0ABV6G0N9_9GAMM|nr:NAD(P)H-dependent oxidoreductase [Kushneria aurantia]
MTTLLRIDASARFERSLTRMLGDLFIERWQELEPGVALITRDVGRHPPAIITAAWIAAAFTPMPQRSAEDTAVLADSERLIHELEQADVLVIATPMYNYGMPAALKAWLDQVIRLDRTFSFDLARGDRPLAPMLDGKQLVLLTASGEFGFGAGEPNEGADHLLPHLRSVAKYLGADNLCHVGIEYQEFGDQRFEDSRAHAIEDVKALAARMAG